MTDFKAILDEAHAAARAAVEAKGPENIHACDCGFAWVTIDGTSPLARYCRKMRKEADREPAKRVAACREFGDKGYPTGWQWWKPGDFAGQAIGHHEAGARAFRDVLTKHDIRADMGSRYD